MKNSFKVLSIGGIAIYVNWSWLLAIAFITWSLGDFYHTRFPAWSTTADYVVAFISGVLLFVTVLLHELSHALTARSNGLPVNTIVLFIFGGVANLTREPQTPRVELLVAVAGPLVSLALAGLFYLLHAASGSMPTEVSAVLGYLASVNLILAIFNLIPGFPLDGGRVLRALLWMGTGSLRRATQLASTVGQGIGYLFLFAGLIEAFVYGQVLPGIWLAFIGWFLQNAASGSYQQAMLDRALSGIDVDDVMDRAPAGIGPGVSVEEAVNDYMIRANQRAVPVNGPDGTFLGLVTLTDVQHVDRDAWRGTTVGQVMTPLEKLTVLPPGEHLRSAVQRLAENGYHQIPVVQNGRLVGMLNRAHVMQYLHMRERLAGKGDPPADRPGAQGISR